MSMTGVGHPEVTTPKAAIGRAVGVAVAGRAIHRRPQWGRRLWVQGPLVLVGLVAAAPFLWMLATSFKTGESAQAYPPQWWPHPFTLRAYRDLFSSRFDFLLWTRNTLIVEALVVSGTHAQQRGRGVRVRQGEVPRARGSCSPSCCRP